MIGKIFIFDGGEDIFATLYKLPFDFQLIIYHREDFRDDCHDSPYDYWRFALTPYVESIWSNGRLHQAPVNQRWTPVEAAHCSKVVSPYWRATYEWEPIAVSIFGKKIRTAHLSFITRLSWLLFGSNKIAVIRRIVKKKRGWGYIEKTNTGFSWITHETYAKVRGFVSNEHGI